MKDGVLGIGDDLIEEILLIIAILLGSGLVLHFRYRIVGWLWINTIFEKTIKYETDIMQLETPLQVQAYMDKYFKYVKDKRPEDYWKDARTTWTDGQGDCEDYAVFSADCLKDRYEIKIFCSYGTESGHATCLVKDFYTDKWLTIGTFGYQIHNHCSYESLAEHWYEDWESYTIYDEYIKFVESVSR